MGKIRFCKDRPGAGLLSRKVKAGLVPLGAALFAVLLTACSGLSSAPDGEETVLSMAIGGNGEKLFSAGVAAASAVNNSGSGIFVEAETSKGSPVNAKNLAEGSVDLAMVSGRAAYDAWHGTGIFEGEEKKELYALAACYPEASQWIALKGSGYAYVRELSGKRISAGTPASDTEEASELVFSALGMENEEENVLSLGLSAGADALRNGEADGAHGFSAVPIEAFGALFNEQETVLLQYTEEELKEILSSDEALCEIEIPAGTYAGQEEPVKTFGTKTLFCTRAAMEEEMAYEIAKALDEKAGYFTAGYPFLAFMQDGEFLCRDLPIPLHPGAERYYREAGYLD